MYQIANIFLPDEKATNRLGAWLGGVLGDGDILCLSGDLGAGKSMLARGLIQSFIPGTPAPSPTFTFVETYEAPSLVIWHYDLYRLEKPEDIWELGLEEALEGGLLIIEWPERAQAIIPTNALSMTLKIDGSQRTALIRGNNHWQRRLKRVKFFNAEERR